MKSIFHKLRRGLAFALLAAAAPLALAQASAETTVRLTVPEYSKNTEPWFNEAKQAFEKQNPDIKVQVEMVPWDTLQQKLITDVSGGQNADAAIIGTRWLTEFQQQDLVEPFDAYIDKAFRSRFFDIYLKPATIDGKLYGLPFGVGSRGMYYNKDIFAKAGIAEPPKTWDDVESAAAKIKAANIPDVFGFGLQGKNIETDVYFYYPLWSYGGDILGPDGKSAIASPAGMKAINLYLDMIKKGYTEPGVTSNSRDDLQNLFKQGRIGMMITGSFLAGQLKSEAPNLKYGVVTIPKGTQNTTYIVTDSMVMFKNSKHKKETMKFLDFIYQPEWRVKIIRAENFMSESPQIAAMPEFANDPDLKAFNQFLSEGRFAPLITGWEKAADAVTNALQKIYLGEADPAATLKAAADQVNEAIGK